MAYHESLSRCGEDIRITSLHEKRQSVGDVNNESRFSMKNSEQGFNGLGPGPSITIT